MSSCVCKILFKSEQICGCCCKMLRGSLFGTHGRTGSPGQLVLLVARWIHGALGRWVTKCDPVPCLDSSAAASSGRSPTTGRGEEKARPSIAVLQQFSSTRVFPFNKCYVGNAIQRRLQYIQCRPDPIAFIAVVCVCVCVRVCALSSDRPGQRFSVSFNLSGALRLVHNTPSELSSSPEHGRGPYRANLHKWGLA